MAGELADAELEPAHDGGLTTSEAERSLNEEDEEVEGGEAGEPVRDAGIEEPGGQEPIAEQPLTEAPEMEEQKAGEA
jgi:hypothetical protein